MNYDEFQVTLTSQPRGPRPASNLRNRELPQPPTQPLRRPSRGELFMRAMLEDAAKGQEGFAAILKEELPLSPSVTSPTTPTASIARARSNTQSQLTSGFGTTSTSESGTRSRSGSLLVVPGQQPASEAGTPASASLTFRPRRQDEQGRLRGTSVAAKSPSPLGPTLTVPSLSVNSASGSASGGATAATTTGPMIPPGARYRYVPT